MKKALIAMSIAAGMVAVAQAENTTTLYGSLGYQTQVNKVGGSVSGTGNAFRKNTWDLDNATAKIGVTATEDLSNGMQAFFKFEFGANTQSGDKAGLNDTRYAYIGLTGEQWGTLTFGKQKSLYNDIVDFNDNFQSVFYEDGLAHFGTETAGSRLPKTISYVSPNWSGFQFGLAGVLDGSKTFILNGKGRDFNAAQAGLWYDNYGFYAGLAYSVARLQGGNNVEVTGAAVGYKNDQFKAGFGAEHLASGGEVYNLGGEYYYGPNTFRGGFSYATKETVGQDKGAFTYALGYQYNFSKRTYTWVEGQYSDYNSKNVPNGYTVKVGLRHDF